MMNHVKQYQTHLPREAMTNAGGGGGGNKNEEEEEEEEEGKQ